MSDMARGGAVPAWFTRVADLPSDPRRRAELLSLLLVSLVPIGLACGTFQYLIKPDYGPQFAIVGMAALLGAVAWILNRFGHFWVAAWTTVLIPTLAAHGSLIWLPADPMAFAYPVLSVILAGVFLSLRATVLIAVVNLICLAAITAFDPEITLMHSADSFGFNLLIPTLVVASRVHRNQDERIRARALKASEERYRTLVETMNDGLIVVTPDMEITFANRRLLSVLGLDADDVVGRRLEDVLSAELVEVLGGHCGAGGTATVVQEISLSGAKGPIDFRVSPTAIRDRLGRPVGCFAVLTDITERKRAEAILRRNERKFRVLIENALDVISVLDRDARVVYESPSIEQKLGFKPEELIGRNALEFVHPDDAGRVIAALQAGFMNPGEPQSAEFRFLNADGEWPILEAVGQGLQDEVEPGWALVVNSRDVTEHRRLEREVLEISDREQRRLGRDLHDGMGQMLVGARFHASAIERRLRKEGRSEADAVAALGALLDDAHAQARALARGLTPLSLDERGLDAALTDLAGDAERILGIQVDVALPEPELVRDLNVATHLYRIAQEAISNAARHGRATVANLALGSSQNEVQLTVVDDGCGFALDSAPPGGMGLRIMRYRTRIMHGVLDIESEPGQGTTVRCRIAQDTAAPVAVHASR
ncbi:MAG: PAS domain S-box protein [Gemmatimonadota bacterium]